MSFRTAEPALKDVLDGIASGQIQLPDFQRGWVWDDNHIRSLIASLSLSYPIGAVMFLEAGGVPFKPRLFAGVNLQPAPAPKTLVLDGQQRLTSMYLALRSGQPVPTRTEKGANIRRLYFLDMTQCLDESADREDAVLSVPETLQVTSDFGRKVDLDVSTPDLQYSQRLFPVALLFDIQGFMAWESGFSAHHQFAAEAMQFMQRFRNEIWLRFQQFKVPAIELTQDTPREAVCQVFEKVNTGGVTLTVFELMTATFAADEFNLRDDWEARQERLTAKHDVLTAVDGTSFLTAVTLLASYRRHKTHGTSVSCKRADVLKLPLADFKALESDLEKGFKRAAELLAEEKIFDDRSLPYATQLIPLSAICAHLADRTTQHGVKQKLLRWYWSGVLGELYGGANETRFGMDIQDVVAWVESGSEPRTVRDANFAPTRLLSLQSRLAAAYKGLAALLMKHGGRDFVSGTPIDLNTYFNNAIDIHHVFPRAWCEKQKLPKEKWNSVVNKAPLAAGTNRFISGDAPSMYLARIQKAKQVAPDSLDEFLLSHVIPVTALRSDDFDAFIRQRAAALLKLIEQAMGKTIAGRDSEETVKAFGAALSS
ncbi:GmrSD restriction endonuclease domain-containing protein [Pseudomonas paraeruginosa]|uniref:GmrSD restriction endonuclease domain-containing protein n=1 Tax=Pseudomonas paraeruginosa TaxID=2994495 RepID=UPI003A80765C